jgi:hypothetical protein
MAEWRTIQEEKGSGTRSAETVSDGRLGWDMQFLSAWCPSPTSVQMQRLVGD